jgi:hypothetical protein
MAREPQLIDGAKGARILTEINRLPQGIRVVPEKNPTSLTKKIIGGLPLFTIRP